MTGRTVPPPPQSSHGLTAKQQVGRGSLHFFHHILDEEEDQQAGEVSNSANKVIWREKRKKRQWEREKEARAHLYKLNNKKFVTHADGNLFN